MLVADGCSGFPRDKDNNPIIPDDRLGILRYDKSSTEDPTTQSNEFGRACADEPYKNLRPVLKWNVGKPSNERMFFFLSICSHSHSHFLFHNVALTAR